MKHFMTLFIEGTIMLLLVVNLFAQEPVTIKIFDSEVSVSMMSNWEQTLKFASKDTIKVKVKIVEGDDISKFALGKWGKKPVITRKAKKVIDEVYFNPKESAYTFRLENSAITKSKTYHIEIYRTTIIDSLIDFDVTFEVDTIIDTSYVQMIESNHSLAGVWALKHYKKEVVIPFAIPDECTGELAFLVGTEGGANKIIEALKMGIEAAGIAASIQQNPAALIFKGASHTLSNLPDLPEENYVNYWIVNQDNLELFRAKQGFYCFKKGEKVTAEKAIISLDTNTPYYFIVQNIHVKSMKVSVNACAMKTEQRLVPK